jgi:hypothetical protein
MAINLPTIAFQNCSLIIRENKIRYVAYLKKRELPQEIIKGNPVLFHLQRSRPLNMGKIGCPETSVRNYHYMPRNVPEERRYHHKILPSSGLNIPYMTPRAKAQNL